MTRRLLALAAVAACSQSAPPATGAEATWYGGPSATTFAYALSVSADGTLTIEDSLAKDRGDSRGPQAIHIAADRARRILAPFQRALPKSSRLPDDSPQVHWRIRTGKAVVELKQGPLEAPTTEVLDGLVTELRAAGAFP